MHASMQGRTLAPTHIFAFPNDTFISVFFQLHSGCGGRGGGRSALLPSKQVAVGTARFNLNFNCQVILKSLKLVTLRNSFKYTPGTKKHDFEEELKNNFKV